MSSAVKLTVALIVKNEAELLPRFLAAVKPLCDELVAVDTGSSDATVQLLTEAGAKVLHRAWDGDFSAARNFGLAHAQGEWVLFLDADEFVREELVAQVRALLADEQAGAATLVMHNALPHGHVRQSRLLRLFRNDPAVRFRYPIHEEVSSAVEAYLQRTGRKLRHLDGGVDHVGYVRARAAAKDKKARDLGILERCLKADPGDLYSHFKRLELARFWSDRPLWKRAAADALKALSAATPQALSAAPYAGELLGLIAEGLHRGLSTSALALFDAYAARLRPSAALFLRRGELRELAGDAAGAAQDFERCLTFQRDLGNLQLSSVRPLLGLARLALAAQDLRTAQRHIDAALAHNGRDPEALLAAALLHRAAAGLPGLTAFFEQRSQQQAHTGELREAVAEAAVTSGDYDFAVKVLEAPAAEAQAAPQSPQLHALRAQAALGLGDVQEARVAAERAFQGAPEAGLGVLVCDLAQGRDSELDLPFEPAEASAHFRRWLEPIRRGRSDLLRERIRALAPALKDAFPWLPAHIAAWP